MKRLDSFFFKYEIKYIGIYMEKKYRMEKWADGDVMKFKKENCEVLHLGNNRRYQYMLEADKDLGILACTKLEAVNWLNCQRQLVVPSSALGEVLPEDWGRWSFSPQHWWSHVWSPLFSSAEDSPTKDHKGD